MKIPTLGSNHPGVIRISVRRAGSDIILLYRLVKEPADDELSRFQYSLTVTKSDNGGSGRDVRRVADISRSRAEAERIFSLVSRGCVFPETATEVISELISI